MQLGSYKLPEHRLSVLIDDSLRKIYTAVKTDQIRSKDLSKLLGYKYGTEVSLFKKINSLLIYGLLEGKGVYNITKFGEDILFPESKEHESELMTKAIMNVDLWKTLYEKNKKNLPMEGFWVQLRNIADVDPANAKKFERRVRDWYTEDVSILPDDLSISDEFDQTGSSIPSNLSDNSVIHPQMKTSQTCSLGTLTVPNMGTIEINDGDTLTIARSYLDVLEKKIIENKTHSQKSPDQSIDAEPQNNIEP